MKNLLPLMLCLLFLSGAQCQTKVKDPRTSIPIVFVDDGDVFPSSWYGGSTNGKFEDLDTSEIKRSREIILRAFEKYPAQVLTKNLRKVFVFKSLEFFGQGYGGTNSNDVVYVANSGKDDGYSDEYVESVFHAEFSSILLRKYPTYFQEQKWRACNGDDVVYGNSGVDALRTGKTGQDFLSELNEQGILDEYSLSDIENDFNCYAKNLFNPKPGFWEIVDTYPRVKSKVLLIVAFYSKLDPAIDERWFRKFGG
jgi:hypothetical protein